ncbi:MAG TPA: hypothetical protein VIM31_01420 [Candidatus Microsaccharimonas sp.]|jgi:predicted secreted Zn-dependent protease
MRSIQQLQGAANKERQKAEGLRHEAQKSRQKSQDNMADAEIYGRYALDAQKHEEKAAEHDQIAIKFEAEMVNLEAHAVELNKRKTEIQSSSQAQIEKLDQEERMLRG